MSKGKEIPTGTWAAHSWTPTKKSPLPSHHLALPYYRYSGSGGVLCATHGPLVDTQRVRSFHQGMLVGLIWKVIVEL